MKEFFKKLTRKAAAAAVGEAIAVGVFVAVVSIVALFGELAPAIDLFSHFRLQYAILFLVVTGFALLGKRWIFAGFFVCMAIFNAALAAMLWLPPNLPPLTRESGELSILDMNINFENENSTAIAAAIERYKSDLIVIEELTPTMLAKLKPVLKNYPFQGCAPANSPFGIGVFSKTRLDNIQKNPLSMDSSYIMTADIKVGDKPVTVIAVHMFPPVSAAGVSIDSNIFEKLPGIISHSRDTKIMVGDFNATPWSSLFRRLIASGNFKDSEQGHGMEASWLPIALPIDHAIYTSDCRTIGRNLGPPTGSDHLPVFCRIAVGQ